MEGSARARVEIDIFDLQKDSQYETTDTSESNIHVIKSLDTVYFKKRRSVVRVNLIKGVPFCVVCQILPKGVVSVIGPASSPASGSIVSHICGEKEVSLICKFDSYLLCFIMHQLC